VCEALAEILDRLTRHPDERATFRGNPAALIEALRARGIQFS
jgi:hypothetical protein